jgi:outer membrane protein assembly factor BamE (lipoprotein component of BamABCDE complex)
MNKLLTFTAAACVLLSGCTTASQHQADVAGNHDETQLTVAAVQRTVRLGMSGAEVLTSLGSPNIVSTDENRNEVWVYDRVGTEYSYSESAGGLISLIGGASGSVAGGMLPSYNTKSGANRRSQRTLTIIIHFDDERLVEDFSYHASRF